MIDYPKTSGGIGAFLTPAMNGHGAQVERLAHGEMAEAVSLTNQFLPRAHSKSARARTRILKVMAASPFMGTSECMLISTTGLCPAESMRALFIWLLATVVLVCFFVLR